MRHPNIAPCNHRTLQGATRQLRTLRLSHVAPCDIALSHPATSACRTVRLKKPTLGPKNPVIRTRQCGHSPLPHHIRLPRHTAAIPPSASIIIATSCGNILYTRSYTVRSEFIGPLIVRRAKARKPQFYNGFAGSCPRSFPICNRRGLHDFSGLHLAAKPARSLPAYTRASNRQSRSLSPYFPSGR